MSLTAHFLNQAAAISAREATRRVGIDDWTASKLAPVALSLIVHGLKRNARSVFGAAMLEILLMRYPEDLLRNERRLAAADIRARGRAMLDRTLGVNQERAAAVLADLASIDLRRATELLSMTAAATLSALSRTRRDLRLNAFELRGVLKSEAARIDNADPELVRDIREWVFRPCWPARIWDRTVSAMRPARRTHALAPAE